MPKMKPDRDDRRGNMAGQGGPQRGAIGSASDERQQRDDAGLAGAEAGAGAQRNPGGSSRDTEDPTVARRAR